MLIERKKMEGWSAPNNTCEGRITLDRLAKPETVKVTLRGKEIIPSSFSAYGHPRFTDEQYMLYMYEEEKLKRKKGDYTPLLLKVEYEEMPFDIPRNEFDTVDGIYKYLTNLKDLRTMLNYRSMYCRMHPGESLNEYVIFNCFYLDQFGQVMSVENPRKVKRKLSDVIRMNIFSAYNRDITFCIPGRSIPTEGSRCPCCGKLFTIDDVKTGSVVSADGKYYHDKCQKKYRHLSEIDKLTRCLMDTVYDFKDYTFEIIPNGYCNRDCCKHIPWLFFHTPDGDIIVGWRKRVISIEWQGNYKQFDMDELFGIEDVTKWEENGKRGIHAWGREKAYEYLKNVRSTVNPSYNN